MVDIANFLAQNSPRFNRADQDMRHYQNALVRNDVERIPQANRAQDLNIQGAEQDLSTSRMQNARQLAQGIFSAIADSPDPIATGAMLTQSEVFRAVGGELKLPVDQFRPAPGDKPEQIRAAARSWARTAPAERAELLKAGARRLRDSAEELAVLQTREMGKPIGDSRGGVEAGIATLEQYAELGPLHRGRTLQGGWDATDVMVHVPFGVAACILPWNDPVAVGLGLIGACAVAGNAVVAKPSERAPLAIGRAIELLGLPTGVVSVSHGAGKVGAALVDDPHVDLVCHVGSLETGSVGLGFGWRAHSPSGGPTAVPGLGHLASRSTSSCSTRGSSSGSWVAISLSNSE